MWEFSPSEIAQISMKIEENGMAFYRAIAATAKEKEAIELFNFMAGEEAEHYQTFKALADKLRGCDMPTLDHDQEEYMRQLANNNIFAICDDVEKYARSVKSTEEAIRLSLGFEIDSVLFYLQFKKMVPDRVKHEIDTVIEEEHKHYQKLITIRKMYTATRQEFYIPKGGPGDAEI